MLTTAYTSVHDDYRLSQVQVFRQVHKAIRDGEFNWLPELVTDHRILWEANKSSGWTSLHYAASHFLPIEWWDWILERASYDRQQFHTARTVLGQTVLDVFLSSYTEPLPWQSLPVKNRAKFLMQAIQNVTRNDRLLERLKNAIERDQCPLTEPDAVCRCFSFYQNLIRLYRAACTNQEPLVAFVAQGECPEPVVRLLLQLDPTHARTALPLQIWCESKLGRSVSSPSGMLQGLLQAHPEAASKRQESTGRYPLHLAVQSGKSWQRIAPLFERYPVALQLPDPVTKLPLVALCATQTYTSDDVLIHARIRSAGSMGLVTSWNLLQRSKRQEALEQAKRELDCQHMTTIYEILHKYPQVCTIK